MLKRFVKRFWHTKWIKDKYPYPIYHWGRYCEVCGAKIRYHNSRLSYDTEAGEPFATKVTVACAGNFEHQVEYGGFRLYTKKNQEYTYIRDIVNKWMNDTCPILEREERYR